MVEVVTRDQLKQGLADGSIALVDVREPNEFAAGHIPGAIPCRFRASTPRNCRATPAKRIVFNCRSGKRTLQAIEMARLAGRRDASAHYEGSILDWVAAGEKLEM